MALIDPYSSRTQFENALDYMQREIDYKFKKMQDQLRYQPPQLYQAIQVGGELQIYKNGIKQEESEEQKTAKEKTKKLRNLIAYYYSR